MATTLNPNNPEQLKQLQQMAADAVAYDDMRLAFDVIKSLKAAGFAPNTSSPNKLDKTYRLMQFVRLPQIDETDCLYLLQNALLEGLALPEYDLTQKFEDRLDFIMRQQDQIAFIEKAFTALKANSEVFGDKPLTMDGSDKQQLIKTWLVDYESVPGMPPERGSLEEVAYMSKSANVKKLNPDQQNILRKLLKFYDLLRNITYVYSNTAQVDVSTIPDFDLNLFMASEGELDTKSVPEGMTAGDGPSVPPIEAPQPQSQDIRKAVNIQDQLLKVAKPMGSPPAVEPLDTPKAPTPAQASPLQPQAPAPVQKPASPAASEPSSSAPLLSKKSPAADLHLKPDIFGKDKHAVNVQALLNAEHQTVVDGDMKVMPKGVTLRPEDKLDIEKIKQEIEAKRGKSESNDGGASAASTGKNG